MNTYTIYGYKNNELVAMTENVESKYINPFKGILHAIDGIDFFCVSTKDGSIVYEETLAPLKK